MSSPKRRAFLTAVGGAAVGGLSGCSEYIRNNREQNGQTGESGAEATDGSGSDRESEPEVESEPDSEAESGPEPMGLLGRTERVMEELRWYRSEYTVNQPRFTDTLAEMKTACNALIGADAGGSEILIELERAYDDFSAVASTLSTRYPYAGEALEDISDEAERLVGAIGVTDEPAMQSNLVETARVLRNKTREHISQAADEDVLSADVLSGELYEYLQSETVRGSDAIPVFELRVALKRNVDGPQSSFAAGAHPADLDDDLDGDVFRRRESYGGGDDRFDTLEDYKQPLERFTPFSEFLEFNQEAILAFGEANGDEDAYREITEVSLQVLEHGSPRAATDAVETIISELDAVRQPRVDLDTGEEAYGHPIGGHDWTMIRYQSWKNDWEEGSDRTWKCLLLTVGRFTLVFDPYLADEYGAHRWNDLKYTWVWEA